jgi:long-subunit acyl-CoA synthetase (AMP-forming)
LIGTVCCIGDARPYNVALITLDPDAAQAFAARLGVVHASLSALAADQRVQAEIDAGIERANEKLARVEQIKRFTVLAVDWGPDSDELTPTMKLKRRTIEAKYRAEIEALYAS